MDISEACDAFYDEYQDKYGIWGIGLGGKGLSYIVVRATAENKNIPQEYKGFKVVAKISEPPCSPPKND